MKKMTRNVALQTQIQNLERQLHQKDCLLNALKEDYHFLEEVLFYPSTSNNTETHILPIDIQSRAQMIANRWSEIQNILRVI